jgi:hypothetical protein
MNISKYTIFYLILVMPQAFFGSLSNKTAGRSKASKPAPMKSTLLSVTRPSQRIFSFNNKPD